MPDTDGLALCAEYLGWGIGATVSPATTAESGAAIVMYTGRLQCLSAPGELAAPVLLELDKQQIFAPCFQTVTVSAQTTTLLTLSDLGHVPLLRARNRLLDQEEPTHKVTVANQLVVLPSGDQRKIWHTKPTDPDCFPSLKWVLEIADTVRTEFMAERGHNG
ncbi:hypothetical protein IU500_06835 [Nocardia terpenica]|uniref:hypothetical protein n=1 Tax=Nocardia terpenica TaxID=455432 RepID=UPI0018937C88|nr:hypothetical protein [Nocardia terpenica]MBF6060491.1 hypothetical protein [Nocardia terpenica]MBF6103751.1 hypothetical protein [Nocardia terpenica]MBF6111875.1 hypothetical protein [Nocardia terpenica]MBF6117972.1 hypothetical protein [Nocardia terpenica]MBF6155302.1 hypothetical protein [Nocardia terpenica]